jgi:hypothetical protein
MVDVEVRFPKLAEAYKAASRIRDLADIAVWDLRVMPLEGNRGLVLVPQVLLDRQPSVADILRKHGGMTSAVVRGGTTDLIGRVRTRVTRK